MTEERLEARIARLEDMQLRLGSGLFGGVTNMNPVASRQAYRRAIREIEAERAAEREVEPFEGNGA